MLSRRRIVLKDGTERKIQNLLELTCENILPDQLIPVEMRFIVSGTSLKPHETTSTIQGIRRIQEPWAAYSPTKCRPLESSGQQRKAVRRYFCGAGREVEGRGLSCQCKRKEEREGNGKVSDAGSKCSELGNCIERSNQARFNIMSFHHVLKIQSINRSILEPFTISSHFKLHCAAALVL